MRVEIRSDSVLIDGYVNAVERESKVLSDTNGTFVEKIKAGAFTRALERAKRMHRHVKVLLNHDSNRELTSTAEATTKISEDAIGLRCQCEIRDAEIVKKAKSRRLSGWSFGFIALRAEMSGADGEIPRRNVIDLDLYEVSILDDTEIPAYNGTSIETRSKSLDDFYEIRMKSDEIEVEDKSEKNETFDNYEWENRYLATRTM